jgi:c-di-GMP-binding flagellar brake protein YcgR
MERRREPRISSSQLVWLTVLGENEVRCRATTIDLSGRGMKLMVAWRLSQDAAVKIEIDDALYLGEICYCRPENGGFMIGIEIDQVLTGLRDLAQLRRRLVEDSAREPLSEYADTASRDDEYRQLREVARTRV